MRGLPDERLPSREAYRAVCGHADAGAAAAAAEEHRDQQQLRPVRQQRRQQFDWAEEVHYHVGSHRRVSHSREGEDVRERESEVIETNKLLGSFSFSAAVWACFYSLEVVLSRDTVVCLSQCPGRESWQVPLPGVGAGLDQHLRDLVVGRMVRGVEGRVAWNEFSDTAIDVIKEFECALLIL